MLLRCINGRLYGLMNLFVNRNIEVSMSGDFWDMPKRIKIGIIITILGVLLFCVSILFMLITNPIELLRC